MFRPTHIKIACCLLLNTVFLRLCVFAQHENQELLKNDSAAAWSFYAEADDYIFPHEQDILMGIVSADHHLLHLEARYNYENRNTASVFAGLNFNFGNQLKLLLTPMAGMAFGSINGAVPALELDLSYKAFDFNSQSEYLFDFGDKQNNFAYTYLQMGAELWSKFELGLAAQRTRLYQTKFDLQRGVFAGYSFKRFSASFTSFNMFTDSYFFIVAMNVEF